MKLIEAKQIIAAIIDWQMVKIGVIDRNKIKNHVKLEDLSLEELIKANKLVKGCNSRKEKLQEHYKKKFGKESSVTTHAVLDDRLIAAIYAALHFEPDNNIKVLVNDVCVGFSKIKYA